MSDEPTPLDASPAATSLAVRVAVGRFLRRLREVAAEGDLTPSQASVLTRVGKGEATTASALAVLEGVRPQSMANTLTALEAAGLVQRAPDPTDGRRQIVGLTDAGSVQNEGNRAARQEWLTEVMAERYTEDERRRLLEALALLDRVAEAPTERTDR
ncbi:MarR family transcriptional regulator [Curtobacterium sp. MCBD17_040]|uniref:MarR family winged helix-turn-helix transcriptional regulator n=1 Tax=Curtobacterium sp. MCBD17_040 TaxID=2175674 RepID=UPI000DA9398A|nr:MarR family transcriptional regulator [Curtobacterium sp. MCBD17_040]WIB64656.1 winged helix DNA-binding protein [Curtobacterium sp. MCBD17_040]